MLTIERVAREFGELPLMMRAGIVVLVVGGIADIAAHVLSGDVGGHTHGFSPAESAAHLTAFVGMVLVLLGVVMDGVTRHPKPRAIRSADTER